MSDDLKNGTSGEARSVLLKLLGLGVLSAVIGYGAVYVSLMGADNDTAPKGERAAVEKTGKTAGIATELRDLASGDMATFVFKPGRPAAPELSFVNGENKEVSFKDWRGKYVLVNLWATWCAPCRKEMPALSKLKAELGGENFDILALSIDADGLAKPRKFLEKAGISNLKLFNKPGLAAKTAFKAIGMPTSILLDRDGREVGRLAGAAEWDGSDAKALILGVLKQGAAS